MKEQDINRIIYQPGLFSPDYLPQLERVVADFPYFQPAYFFLLKYYKNQSYAKYAEMIERFIWHISDKQLLHEFLNRPIDSNVSATVESASVVTENTPSAETLPYTPRREKDSLQETLSEALSQAAQGEVPEDFEKKILPEIDFELDETIEIIKPTNDVDEFSLLRSAKGNEKDENFLELDEGQGAKTEQAESIPDETAYPTSNVSDDTSVLSNTYAPKTSQQFALIDEFLEKLPHIKPQPVPESVPAVDISQNSVEVHDDFMTETFARILVKQGSYDRAIEIYRKLILKFPEKNTYFAGQIEEIEKLKNNPKP